MKLHELQPSDRDIFEQFLGYDEYCLSAYHFSNIFIWRKLFRIFYTILNEHLCIFFKDKDSCFMYLPPLPHKVGESGTLRGWNREPDPTVIKRCFEVTDRFNVNKEISRIENVGEEQVTSYQELGYVYSTRPGDYLCRRKDITLLKGNKFKSKRSSYNYFIKHYNFEFRPFQEQDKSTCLALYQRWVQQRKDRFVDILYQMMLKDSSLCQEIAMANFRQLGLIGYVLEIKDNIAGYTFGFPINSRTFCILFEICNLTYRGISQFIFSQFCQQLPNYQYINIMDDSGLLNLRKVKLSYHPFRIVASYIIKRA